MPYREAILILIALSLLRHISAHLAMTLSGTIGYLSPHSDYAPPLSDAMWGHLRTMS